VTPIQLPVSDTEAPLEDAVAAEQPNQLDQENRIDNSDTLIEEIANVPTELQFDQAAISDSNQAEHSAATKIQAVFRGHKVRKDMKTDRQEDEMSKEELEAEFRADDEELCHAATKIQASFRGHMARKEKEPNGKPDEKKEKDLEEELDIDLNDPELSKAAVKIQASFRGHLTRKEK